MLDIITQTALQTSTTFSEMTTLVIQLLPVLVFLMVFKWIFKIFSEIDFGWGDDDSILDDDGELIGPRKPKVREGELSLKHSIMCFKPVHFTRCPACEQEIKDIDEFCGNCGQKLKVENKPVKIEVDET